MPSLAGGWGHLREGEKTPAEINTADPHPEAVMAVPCLAEAVHVKVAKISTCGLRCNTFGLPPWKLQQDRSSAKRPEGGQEGQAAQRKRIKLGGNHDMATVALSCDGVVLNSAKGDLLPGHASMPGVRCSRMCLTCTEALLRFQSGN